MHFNEVRSRFSRRYTNVSRSNTSLQNSVILSSNSGMPNEKDLEITTEEAEMLI